MTTLNGLSERRFHALTRIFQSLVKVRMLMAGDVDRYYVYLAILVGSSADARRNGLSYDDPEWPMLRTSVLAISEMTGIPRQTVQRKLQVLQNSGLIAIEDGGYARVRDRAAELDIVMEMERNFRLPLEA
jgi:CRP-like cAMP-binding protein